MGDSSTDILHYFSYMWEVQPGFLFFFFFIEGVVLKLEAFLKIHTVYECIIKVCEVFFGPCLLTLPWLLTSLWYYTISTKYCMFVDFIC